jgi:hypothetical protein
MARSRVLCLVGLLALQLGCEVSHEPPSIRVEPPEPHASTIQQPRSVPVDAGASSLVRQAPQVTPTCGPMAVPAQEYRIRDIPIGATRASDNLDLDGDGTRDRWVTASGFCAIESNCVYAIYLRRRACGQHVGVTWGIGTFTRLSSRHAGLYDFEATSSNMGNIAIVRYRYNGREYVGSEQRICLMGPWRVDHECGNWMPLGDVRLPVDRWDQPGLWPHQYAPR